MLVAAQCMKMQNAGFKFASREFSVPFYQ